MRFCPPDELQTDFSIFLNGFSHLPDVDLNDSPSNWSHLFSFLYRLGKSLSSIVLLKGRRGPSFPFGHICKSNMPYIRVFYFERYIDSILLKHISWQCQELLRWYNNLFQQLLYPPNIEIYPSTIREQKLSESRTNVLDATLLIIRWRVTAFTASISYSIFRIFAWKWQF